MKNNKKKSNAIARKIYSYLVKTHQESLAGEVAKKLGEISGNLNKATVITPVALSLVEQKKAVELVARLTKHKKIEIDFKEEPKLVDGIKVIYGDKVWDLSLSGQVESLIKSKFTNS